MVEHQKRIEADFFDGGIAPLSSNAGPLVERLNRLFAEPLGRVPSIDVEGGRHEVDHSQNHSHEILAVGALSAHRVVRRSGTIMLSGKFDDVLAKLRRLQQREARR